MFAALSALGELFSSQWNVVLGIGLAFLLLQVVLSLRLYLRTRQQARVLERLSRDFERGGRGRGSLRSLPKNFSWLRWVLAIFPAKGAARSGNFTRDDVLNELDARIASNSDYLLLQRLGIMAPLLGVILTVVGFYWLKVDESDEQSLQSILLSVTPLVTGVGAGAALALVNQVLLHFVGGRVEKLRMLARMWFDTVIWRNLQLDSSAATAKAVAAIEQFTRSITDSAERHDASSGRLEGSTAAMQNAATLFQETMTSFNAEIKEILRALSELRNVAAVSASALEELIPVGKRAVANLDVSVAAFRTTIDREFAAAAQLHDHSSKVLAESIQHIGDSTQLLKSSSDEVKQTAQSNAVVFERMDDALRQHFVPGIQQFFEAMPALTDQVAVWRNVASALSDNVNAVAGELNKLATGILPSVTSACDGVDRRIGQSVAEHGKQVESIGSSTIQLRETADRILAGNAALNALLNECVQFADRAVAIQETLTDTAQGLAGAGNHLQRTIESYVVPTQRAAHETATSFAQSAEQLTDFIEHGLGPTLEQLAMLRETLAGLEDAVNSVKEVSHAGDNIDRLTEALIQVGDITDGIATLPTQIREVLEQNADHNASLAKSRGGLSSWILRRPR